MNPLLQPLERYHNRKVLLALSGGSDSVGLLRGLLEGGALVTAAHLEHGGIFSQAGEAVDDPEFVRGICADLGVALEVKTLPVAQICQQKGWGLEQGGRILRYQFLGSAAKKYQTECILTAHTLEDQAETVLLQLLRGTAKATGIAAQRGRLERPWLGVHKAQIQEYLRGLGQVWREDQTNFETLQTRTWLRHRVMNPLRERFPQFEEALARYAQYALEDQAVLTELHSRITPYADLREQPKALLRRSMVSQLEQAQIRIDAATLERLQAALFSPKVEHLALSKNITVQEGKLWPLPPIFPKPDFDFPPSWTLRHRQAGDCVAGPRGHKKLGEFLIDFKIPRGWRDLLWVLVEGSEIHWIGWPDLLEFGPQISLNPPKPWNLEMGWALELARQAAAAGEVPVGAVVLLDGKVVGEGRNRSRELFDMTQHAELIALRQAMQTVGPYLDACTLLVTLEPCPMCWGAALESRVGRLVYGAKNPKAGALGGVADLGGWNWGHMPEVVPHIRALEGAALLEEFFARVRQGKAAPSEKISPKILD